MNDQIQIAAIAAGCTSAVGLAGMLIIRLLRRASLRLSIQAIGAVPVLAIVAGTLGSAEAMFLSQHDLGVVVMVCIVAGGVAFAFSWLLGRQVESGSAALRQAARSLGDEAGHYRPPALPMAAEFAALSRELTDTSAKLVQSRARERGLEQSRRQLVAWVSHDLRTPLAGLRAMAEALEDGLAADPPRYHKQIRAEAERLATMVDDLFELSRIHSGSLQLSAEEIALDDLVSDVLASTDALARERGVRLDGKATGQLTVRADPRELSRALTNLLTNAIRHTPSGGCVHVEARQEEGDALLAVADGCGGIPEADLPRVFDLAWRGAAARSPTPDGGAGLGLAIVRGVAEAHRGSVRVMNTGDGCCFEMRLPANPVPAGSARLTRLCVPVPAAWSEARRNDVPGPGPHRPLSSVCKGATSCPVTLRVRVIHSVSIRTRPGSQPPAREAIDPAQVRSPWHPWNHRTLRAARLAAALAGIAVIITYLVVALSRLTYPFTFEWLESNSLVEVHRLLAGQPLYPAPAAGYVPDGYPPLYFALSAAAASVLGVSYLPLRLVSLVSSLACFAMLGRLVQRETGSAAAGTGAAGVFAAVYFCTHTWFDVGRVDSLFLALSVGGLYAARWMRSTRGAIVAGSLLAAAALTKQTGIAEGVMVLAALAFGPRRRLTCVAALAEVTILGVSTLALGLGSRGWYVYYVFEQMSQHALDHSAFVGFWTKILPVMGIAACAAVIGARRAPLVLLAGCAALVAGSYATLVHSGGDVNDLLPAYLAMALLAGLAMGGQRAWWVAVLSVALVLAQSVRLLSGFHPAQAIPASADRGVGARLTAGLRALGGTVAIPGDPGLSILAGMTPAAAHEAAAYDVLRGSDLAAITSFTRSVEHAISTYQYSAIIFDSQTPPQGYQPWLSLYYRECPQPLLAGVPAAEFRPVAGGIMSRPFSIWLPQGRGSCAASVSTLDGSGKEARR